MRVKFIGTGSGKTSLHRFHTSILVSTDRGNILIDAGDSITRALLSRTIDINKVDDIIITHCHPDHIGGLTSLLVNMYLNKRESSLNIYIFNKNVHFLESLILNNHLEGIRNQFDLNVIGYEFNKIIPFDDIRIKTRKNSHVSAKPGFELHDIHYSASVLISTKENNLFYTSDIGSANDLYVFNEDKIDLMIAETSHIELKEIFESAKMQNIPTVYLTHIDEALEKQLRKFVSDNSEEIDFIISYDGMEFILK